jgi:chemotaxis-related protein WspB
MLFLLFELPPDRYALDVAQVAEVLPMLRVKPVPQAPAAVAGLITYRGVPVPVIDLSALMLGRPAKAQLSTRLIVVHYGDLRGRARPLGLIAEQVTDTMRRDARDFVPTSIGESDAPCSGPISTDDRGVIQWVDVNTLLPASLRASLFAEPGDA